MQIDGDNYLNAVDLTAREEAYVKYGFFSVSLLREEPENGFMQRANLIHR